MTDMNLYCPRTNITHERTSNDMPACDPRGFRVDVYFDARLTVTCAACKHVAQATHQERQ